MRIGRAPALRPTHDDEHGNQVGQVGDDLDPHGVGLYAEHTGDERLERGAGTDEPREVEGLVLSEVEPASLVGRVDGRHHEAGRDDDEHNAGDAKEAREVDADPALVDHVAEDDGEQNAEECAHPAERGVAAGMEGGQQEHHGLEALAQDGEEGHGDQRLGRSVCERRAGGRFEVAFEIPRVFAHPQNHVRDHDDGNGSDHRFETFLVLLREVLGNDLERQPDGDADGDGNRHADPDLAKGIAATLLVQKRGNDAHDERRLHAFSESDHERREHALLLTLGLPNI